MIALCPWQEEHALSQAVQECIQFFDDTIVSLEESLTEDDQRPTPIGRGPVGELNGSLTSNPHPGVTVSPVLTRPLSPNQDIIDLVRPGTDLVQTREPVYHPTSPGSVLLLGTKTQQPQHTECCILYSAGFQLDVKVTVEAEDSHFTFCSSQISRASWHTLKATSR